MGQEVYGGVGVIEMGALWPEGNPLLGPICMSVPDVYVRLHILTLSIF